MTVIQVALLSGTAAAALIQVKAKAFGTFVSPTSGTILYVDPKHDDPQHHSPKLTVAEAREAKVRGLIEDFDETSASTDLADEAEEENRDPNALGTVGTERTEAFAEQDDEGGPGSGTLDSRSSTAWEDRARVEGGVEGSALGNVAQSAPSPVSDVDQESGDDDAPPAPAPKATKAKTAGK